MFVGKQHKELTYHARIMQPTYLTNHIDENCGDDRRTRSRYSNLLKRYVLLHVSPESLTCTVLSAHHVLCGQFFILSLLTLEATLDMLLHTIEPISHLPAPSWPLSRWCALCKYLSEHLITDTSC